MEATLEEPLNVPAAAPEPKAPSQCGASKEFKKPAARRGRRSWLAQLPSRLQSVLAKLRAWAVSLAEELLEVIIVLMNIFYIRSVMLPASRSGRWLASNSPAPFLHGLACTGVPALAQVASI